MKPGPKRIHVTPEERKHAADVRNARYRERNRERINARTRVRRAEMQERILPFKQAPCHDCGGEFPAVCMDFDHRDPTEKVKAVASMVSDGASYDDIVAEIAKCDLVCANCHRIRTWENDE